MKTIRIGIDGRLFATEFTGIGRYTFELTKRLFDKNFVAKYGKFPSRTKLEWVIFMNEPEYNEYDFPDNVKKILVNAKHYSWREQINLCHAIQKARCDLVHFPHFNFPLLYRGKFVVTIHDTTISFFPGKKMSRPHHVMAYKLVIREVLRRAQKIISVSKNTKKDLEYLFPWIKKEKISVIKNGFEAAEWGGISAKTSKAVLDKYHLTMGKFWLYVGVWREHKNITGLIHALSLLNDKYPSEPKLPLVITGKDDPYYHEVRDTVVKLKLEKQVYFVGLVPEQTLKIFYQHAMALVSPSLYEGFGYTPLEAMASGTPTAVSRVSSLPEVCGEASLYFDPYDHDSIAASMHALANDNDLRARLKSKGLQQVKKFAWTDCAKDTLRTYFESLP